MTTRQDLIGSRVRVITGGIGAHGANGLVGTVITREEALTYLTYDYETRCYGGEINSALSEVYVKPDGEITPKNKVWGLCKGYEIDVIFIPSWWQKYRGRISYEILSFMLMIFVIAFALMLSFVLEKHVGYDFRFFLGWSAALIWKLLEREFWKKRGVKDGK